MPDLTKLPKWAQAHIASLTRERDEARAWLPQETSEPERMPVPQWRGRNTGLVFGWTFNAYGKGSVSPCWMDGYLWYQQLARPVPYMTSGSRTAVPMYACKSDAYRALRIAKAAEFARVLAEIDAAIAAAEEETPE